MRVIARLLALCSLSLLSLNALAAPVPGLYQVRETVGSQHAAERLLVLQQALDTLVLRLTGDPEASLRPELLALREAVKLGGGIEVRFAVLMHDLGKGVTPAEVLPSHHGHEDAGVALIEQLCARLRVPNHLRELAVITSRHHTHVHRALELRAATVLKTLESCDAFRRPERFADFLLACEADARGRQGLEQREYPQRAFFAAARERAAAVALDEDERRGLTGLQIGEELRKRRTAAIEELKSTLQGN